MRALIVDDEPPARDMVREYLTEEYPEIEIIGECGTGREAVGRINEALPDLLFLDIQMPGLDGFDVLARIDAVPSIIFSTAYDEYAIQAFDAGAVDYLLKPYSRARFRKAMDRALERADQDRPPERYAERLNALLEATREESSGDVPNRLYVRHGEKIVPVDPADIVYVEAAGDYARLHTEDETHLSSAGIGELEDRLEEARFLRVHRSTIVALPAVKHLTSDGSGGYWAQLRTGDRVRVSRSYADRIRDLIT